MGTDMEQNKDESEHQVIENNKTTEDVIQNVPVTLIDPNPFQPRIDFNENDLQDLSNSIRKHGIIQPIIIRQKGDRYELIAGERRLRAGKKAGLQEVPVIIRQLTDREAAEMALIENLQRKDLNCLEEAEGYQRLLSEFGLTQKELHTVSKVSLQSRINWLLKLPEL